LYVNGRRKFLAHETEAPARRPRRRADVDSNIDMTSMIDVTFLLLIFFMVASQLQPTDEVEVPQAVAGVGVDGGMATVITVFEPSTRDSFARIQLADGTEADDLEDVTESVRAGLAAGRLQVIVKAERRVPHREVQRVFQAAALVEGVTPRIGVQDKY
jgi:biopolymer transport protein ExbD